MLKHLLLPENSCTFSNMLDSKVLTTIRHRLGVSQEQMARLLGVSFASVNRWEGAFRSHGANS